MIDPSALAPGIHTGKLAITSGGETRELSLSVEIHALQLVKLAYDPARPLVYGLHTGSPVFDESQLLAIDAASGAILKVVAAGRNATDFCIDPVTDRIYLNNLNSELIRVVDLAGFKQLEPFQASNDITCIQADHAGRLFVQHSSSFTPGFSILNAENGKVLDSVGQNLGRGNRGLVDPVNGLYYVMQNNSTATPRVFDIRTDSPTYLQTINDARTSGSYPPLLSADSRYFFWNRRSYRTPQDPQTAQASFPGDVIATNPDGEIAVGTNEIWWSDTGLVAATLPFSSTVGVIDASGRHLVLFNSTGGTLSSIELASLVALPGPRPVPGATVPHDDFAGLSWPAAPGAQSYHVYFGTTQPSVNAAVPGSTHHLGNVTGNRFDFDPRPAWGYRYYWRIDTVTASGTIKGEVRYFYIPFPVVGDPLPVTASSPGTIYLDVGTTLLATGLSGQTTSYAIDPDAGSIAFEQLIGGTSAYTRFASSGQEWILRADPKDTSSPGPSTATSWSRDVFQGHWRQRAPVTLSSPADQVSNVQALAADDGHMFAGLSVTTPSGPGKVAAMTEWPRPMLTSRFQASDGAVNDAFGSAIAIDGNRVMVGAHGHSSRPGKAYIFEFQPQTTAWIERAKLQPSTSNSDQSGTAVALAGNHAAMSHGWWSSSTSRPVHLYRFTRTGWGLLQSLNDPDPAGKQFGHALAIHEDMLFVAQPGATGVNLSQGIVHFYHFANGVWTPGAPIMGPVTSSGFANSLAVRDGVLYVSSTNQVHSYQLRAGANRKPRFVSKPPARLVSGRQAALTITATDPDGTTGLVIRSLALPAGMSLTDHGNGSATLDGTPTGPAGSRVFAQWSVSDPAGATTYQGGFIDFIGAGARPVFVRMPASANVGEGQSAHLTASVGNDEAVSWQWFKDGEAIEGAMLPYHIIESATVDAAGVYHVTATNEAGLSQSSSATLAVRPPDLDGGPWSTRGNTATRSGHHPATLGRVTFLPAWTRKLADIGRLNLPVIAGNRVFTGISEWQSGPLLALDLHNGETLWSYPANPGAVGSYSSGAPTWFDGRIYFQTHGNSPAGLHCLDEATGARLWSVPMSAQHDAFSFPAVTRNGIFHCAGYYGGMYGVETDGNLRFFHTPPAYPGGLAAIHQGRVFTFSSGILYEHRPADGTVIWSLTPPNANSSGSQTPVIADDCALVIHSGELLCIDIQTRELRWRRSGQFDGTPAIHNGNAYATHLNGVSAMSLADGTVTADYPTPARPNNYGRGGQQPLLLNDHLLFSSVTATWVFRLADGNLVQTIPAGGGILAYSNGHLLVTGGDGSLYAGNTLHAFRANSAPGFAGETPRTMVASAAADPMTLALGPFASDADAGDPLTWAIASVSRPEVFRTLQINAQSGDLTVIYNPWESGSSDVVVSLTDPAGNVTEHTITFTVPQHPEPQLELAAKLVLNRQTGLYEHAITVTNTGAREIAGFDLRLSGLPEGVTVNNASARDGNDWIIHHRQPLAAAASVNLVLEYYTPVRGTVINPQVAVGIVTVPVAHPDAPEGGLAVERCIVMAGGSVMIEFTTTPGALYEIHYSDDAADWKLSPVRVRAAGNRVQWIDSGPPRTATPPSGEPCRFYRMRELPQQ
jgi:outer membrane protein assembly factor BamB